MKLIAWPADKSARVRIYLGLVLPAFVCFYKCLEAEILRLGYFAAFVLMCCLGIFGALVLSWIVLLVLGIGTLLGRHRNALPILVPLIGLAVAWYVPEPPLREEIQLSINRERYQQVVERGRKLYKAGVSYCFDLPEAESDLSALCVYVSDNYAEFNPNRDVFSLVYSYDEQIPRNRSCYEDGYVRKRIDMHWFVCKEDIN